MATEPPLLLVHNTADLYGASRALLRLAAQLRARSASILVVVPETGPLVALLEALDVEVVVDPWLAIVTRTKWRSVGRMMHLLVALPVSAVRLAALARRRHVRLIHSNTGVILSAALGSRLAGVPHVWHIRDSFHEFRGAWPLYRRYILACSERVVAVSSAMASQFPDSTKVVVVHDALPLGDFDVDAHRMRAAFRSRLGWEEQLVVGCVGRIKMDRKGQEHLIAAAGRLRRRGVVARFVVVGSPSPGSEDHLPKLRELIEEEGLGGDVLLMGELEDTRPAYAAMDVLVVPSAQPEPFGLVTIEAMAMRRPVVATAIGGSVEIVRDGVTGFLVPPADPDALAGRLEELLRDPELRARMGQAGRARVEECFSIESMTARIESVYRAAVAVRNGAA